MYIAQTEIWIINTQLILELILKGYYQYTVNINGYKQTGTQNADNETAYERDMRQMELTTLILEQGGFYQADVKDVTRAVL